MRPSSRITKRPMMLFLPIILTSMLCLVQARSINTRDIPAQATDAFSHFVATSQLQTASYSGQSRPITTKLVAGEGIIVSASRIEGKDEGSEEVGDGQDGETSEGDQSDLVSSRPLDDGKRRAGVLTILLAIGVTSALLYYAYRHQTAILTFISSLQYRVTHIPISTSSLPSLSDIRSSLTSLKMPTIAMPIHTPRRRTRRLRRTKPKGGFRPQASRLNAWASEDGLFDDYDNTSSSSNDADIEHGGPATEALDLGADEDFMIGASRMSSKSPIKPATNAARWWTQPKASKTQNSTSTRNVLFSVGDGEDDVETDEGLPLAPTPHNYGLGTVRGYGSANMGF